MRIALIQSNPLVGDLQGNRRRLQEQCLQASEAGADLALAPELALWGYPPRDLLLQPSLQQQQDRQLQQLSEALPPGLGLLLGVVETNGQRLFNAMALVKSKGWQLVARKRLLPSYDVFDEQRYFHSGEQPALLKWGDKRLGLTLCEDLWVEPKISGRSAPLCDPIAELQPLRPDLLINLSASPFGQGKSERRRQLAGAAQERLGCPVLYVNQVGANDELIFDGNSFVLDANGRLQLQLPCGENALQVWDSEATDDNTSIKLLNPEAELWRMLVLGVQDYARKCGFKTALLGLSGGIDSALVAVLAVAALGSQHVRALLMPSPYSSDGSLQDSLTLATRLELSTSTVPIAPLMQQYDGSLNPALGQPPQGITAENLQSRIRGTLLMAVANSEGQLLLSTGNKSELAVGYCTLYGDMNGGLAVIGDLYKSEVFRLARWLDSPEAAVERQRCGLPAEEPLIGAAILTKPPSAELRPDQKDSDSLPDYPFLDRLLQRFIEEHASPEELIANGEPSEAVQRIWRLLKRSEFKRRQAAPVLKLSARSFGCGWRMPIAASTGTEG